MNVKELRQKSIDELKEEQKNLSKNVTNTMEDLIKGKEKNIKKVKNLRRDIARVLTVIKEKANA